MGLWEESLPYLPTEANPHPGNKEPAQLRTAGELTHPGCGPCPGEPAGCPGLPPNPACSITLAAGTRPKRQDCALRELVPGKSSACRCPLAQLCCPPLLGVSVQGQTFQEKPGLKAWACHLTGKCCQADQSCSWATGGAGNRAPWPPLPLLLTRKQFPPWDSWGFGESASWTEVLG